MAARLTALSYGLFVPRAEFCIVSYHFSSYYRREFADLLDPTRIAGLELVLMRLVDEL